VQLLPRPIVRGSRYAFLGIAGVFGDLGGAVGAAFFLAGFFSGAFFSEEGSALVPASSDIWPSTTGGAAARRTKASHPPRSACSTWNIQMRIGMITAV